MNMISGDEFYPDDVTSGIDRFEALDNCRANDVDGCPGLAGGDHERRTIVVEANEGFLVVADVAP